MNGFRKKKSSSKQPPLIFISPSIEVKGQEFGDISISLAQAYQRAVMAAGGLPLALPCLDERELLAECVRRSDGVLLTGGDDVDPKLYGRRLSPRLKKTLVLTAGSRDFRELILIDEIFRQRKPVFAICRGQQIMNVALGGTLIVDIASEMPQAINHRRFDKKNEIVHQARLTGGSLLAKIAGKRTLGVNSTHHQAVGRVAGPFCVTAQSDDGVVEAMELKPEAAHLLPYFMSVQFHPERLAGRYREHQALFDSFMRACIINRSSTL